MKRKSIAGFSCSKSKGLRGLRIGGLRTGSRELAIPRPRTPPEARFGRRIRNLREKMRRAHPSGASGTDFEASPGPAQFE
eukprot:15387035-Alexandrium_andersonii.AAC.1